MKEGFLEMEDERAYVLRELEVYNWGPFAGKHRAQFDERGTAIIGATGSGKTTLVDALMTLLADQPRYNLASTGGQVKNDRTLVSYIRGVGRGDAVSRPGKTVTGITATYENDKQTVRAGAVLWTDGASNSQQDLKRRWFFAEDAGQTLDGLLLVWESDGARGLMKYGRETGGLRIFESKKAYLAHLRKFFDVGANAFNLLNRAAGLKQLDSVDTIFRELVLDDKAAFDRALEVAGDFDNLAAIHKELEDARRQQESLVPVKKANGDWEKLSVKLAEARVLKQLAPRWYAGLGQELWGLRVAELAGDLMKAVAELERVRGEVETFAAREAGLHEQFLSLGGSDIEQLEKTIELQGRLLEGLRKKAGEYQPVMRALGLGDELVEGEFLRNRELLGEKRPDLEGMLRKLEDEEGEVRSEAREARQRCERLEQQIREVKASPGSNVPPQFQRFRKELAERLGRGEEELPFVAELVQVKDEEAEWRGAIERAIGSNRLRILVPDGLIDDALQWVNQRDNQLHVRLQRARVDEGERDWFWDSYLHKLNVKAHALRSALENLLAGQDYHCVADVEALRDVDHGLTREGMTSGRGGRFDKQDQRSLTADWMTGFDNRDRLQALALDLLDAQKVRDGLAPKVDGIAAQRLERARELQLLERILELNFEDVDVPGAERALGQSREKLERLRSPDSDTKRAQDAFEVAREVTKKLHEEEKDWGEKCAVLESKLDDAKKRVAEYEERRGGEFSEEDIALLEKRLKRSEEVTVANLEAAQRRAVAEVEGQIERRVEGVGRCEKRLIAGMERARSLNPGPYVDADAELPSVPIYLVELKRLEKEALPEKSKRFLEYLNRSSDQGVTQLLAQIDQEVAGIEERIGELNHTLAKVNYRGEHYLQLQLKKLNDTAIRGLERARRQLRDAVLKEDEGRSHYAALRGIVEILRAAGDNRQLVGSRALLDPRYRLEFRVVEVDRSSGAISAEKSGSQSGSGGEKELMSSHILTASLSYALCPSGANRPLYGTIVLDEAFSKSSQSAAKLIVDALKVFGLYPVFVTPNKEISLLKKHTRRAICVQRVEGGSTLATISWEKLEEMRPDTAL